MKLALMQPYLFPYLGYYQLVKAADKFIFLDDVTFIKRGYINRNTILSSKGEKLKFSVPLSKISQNKLIKDTRLHESYDKWKKSFTKTLKHNYGKAPYSEIGLPLVIGVLDQFKAGDSIADLCRASIEQLAIHFGFKTKFSSSSIEFQSKLAGVERVLNICFKEKVQTYINAIGGKKLYASEMFSENGVQLRFILHMPTCYTDLHDLPYLSVIDLLMHCNPDKYDEVLESYKEIQ